MGLHNALASLEAFAPDRGSDLSHDFGVVYASAGVQPTTAAPVTEDGAVVVAAPGARALHAWVSVSGPGGSAERRSTLDLFEGRLSLLVGPHGRAWREAAASADAPIQVLVLGSDVVDTSGDVESRYGLGDGDAVLVRPDGHVAWRLAAGDTRELQSAITSTLGRQPAVIV